MSWLLPASLWVHLQVTGINTTSDCKSLCAVLRDISHWMWLTISPCLLQVILSFHASMTDTRLGGLRVSALQSNNPLCSSLSVWIKHSFLSLHFSLQAPNPSYNLDHKNQTWHIWPSSLPDLISIILMPIILSMPTYFSLNSLVDQPHFPGAFF
jgi:hypothetical protein